jgi:hypothetical protein
MHPADVGELDDHLLARVLAADDEMNVAVLLDARVDQPDADEVVDGDLDVAAVGVAPRVRAHVRIVLPEQVANCVSPRRVEADATRAAVAQRLDPPTLLAAAELERRARRRPRGGCDRPAGDDKREQNERRADNQTLLQVSAAARVSLVGARALRLWRPVRRLESLRAPVTP